MRTRIGERGRSRRRAPGTRRLVFGTTGPRRGLLAAVLSVGLLASGLSAISALAVPTPAQAAPGDPWTCSADGFLFQSPNSGAVPHNVYQVNIVTGESSQILTTLDNVNAVGYNTTDNFMYGFDANTQKPVKIDSEGNLTQLPLPAGVATLTYNVGDFDDAGHYWMTTSAATPGSQPNWYEVDYAAGSATYGQLISSGTFPTNMSGSDWTFVDGALYSINDGTNHLIKFDTATNAATDLGALNLPAGNYGAAYADSNGYTYFSNNTTGEIYRVNPADLSVIDLASGPPAGNNDGARCGSAPIPTITVQKSVDSRAGAADQFTVGLNDSTENLASATTVGTDTSATTTDWPVVQGAEYTITDAMAAGSSNTLAAYTAAVVCSDPATGQTFTTGGSKGAWTFTVPGNANYECGVTNTASAPAYTVSKTSSPAVVAPGDTVTYTVTVTNTGPVNFTAANPASFSDDLTAVLDDATYNNDATGGATYAAPTLSWSGPLAVGATQTITYTATVNSPDNGDHVLTNAVVPGDGGICDPNGECTTTTPVQSLAFSKTADKNEVVPGDTITYTITVQNTGQADYTAADPATMTDDLSEVIDDATYNNDATGGATYAAPTLSWSGPLAVGATQTITYTVTINNPITGDSKLTNAVVGNDGNCPTGSTDPACTVEIPSGSYTASKAASTQVVKPGDTVTYTVTITNTGQVAYTAASPAGFADDLTAVLDDATYNNDASNGATVSGNTLSWSGPLAVGASTTITYTVTVNDPDTGDKELRNTVTVNEPGGVCVPNECTTTTPVQSFTTAKSSSPSGEVHEGDTVTYTVTVTNTGKADYTAADPATFTDDLTAVLDDATYNNDANGGATYAAPTLSWSGPLAVGATQTITYTVTVNNPDTGDKELKNAVVPGDSGECATEGGCTTTNPVQSFTTAKSSAPSGEVHEGDTVTYTVTVTNTGKADYTAADPATFTDDLTAVLDDATYNNDANGGATYAAPTLSWSGPLTVGASTTITYTVTVNTPDTGDHTLRNAVVPGDSGECATEGGCTTTNPVQSYTTSKSVDVPEAKPGDVVTYTVTVINTGQVAYTAATPATFTDDLTAVLDDATYNNDATGGATVNGVTLSWSGPLAIGETLTVTYSVTVNSPDNGDHNLGNTVVPGPDGSCDPNGECITNTPIKSLTFSKTADTNEVVPGDTITYTITVQNTGKVDYTTVDPATFTDDMTEVLDDATYNNDATGGATYAAPTLSWSGPLAVGATQTITYTVTVNNPVTGDSELRNAVVGNDGNCPTGSTDPACIVEIPSGSYTVAKTASTTVASPGDTVTYTLTVTNTGKIDYTAAKPAATADDLSGVLDDATYNNDATNGATLSGNTLSWSGPLAVGASTTITYTVTINNPVTGDKLVRNTVRPTTPGGTPCAPGTCITETPVRVLQVSKAVDSTTTAPGKKLTYTITITNTGAADYTTASPATFTDDLSAVIDDATYNGDATNGATYAAPTLSWKGPLTVGASQTVTYSVTVNNPDTGDHMLRNAVVTPGSNCPAGSSDPACSVTTNVPKPPLASTGVGSWLGMAGIGGLVAILMGFGAMFIRRRQTTESA